MEAQHNMVSVPVGVKDMIGMPCFSLLLDNVLSIVLLVSFDSCSLGRDIEQTVYEVVVFEWWQSSEQCGKPWNHYSQAYGT